MTATLQDRLREQAEDYAAWWPCNCWRNGPGDQEALLHEAAAELSRLESACESAVVEIDRLRRQLDLHQSANPALLGALERAGADPVGVLR